MGRAEELFDRLERHGIGAIDTLIAEVKHEELFLDFKQSANNGATRVLHERDLQHLRKALSGFANAEGGVVVWGVGADAAAGSDAPTREPQLEDCRAFAGRIDSAISGGTIPPIVGARSTPIPSGDGLRGYVATLVPASPNAPHQMVGENRYYQRSGASFMPVSHGVLAGLFGRQPRPLVAVNFGVGEAAMASIGPIEGFSVDLRLMLVNLGSVVASDAFLSWEFIGLGGPNCRVHLLSDTSRHWQIDAPAVRIGSSLAQVGNRLAPKAIQTAVRLGVRLVPPIGESLHVQLTFGCAGAPPEHREWTVSAQELSERIESGLTGFLNRSSHDRQDLATKLLGLDRLAGSAP